MKQPYTPLLPCSFQPMATTVQDHPDNAAGHCTINTPVRWPVAAFILCFLLLITGSTAGAQSCLPDGITFSSQAQIDAFPMDYPGCTEIAGNITIKGGNIERLDSLAQLTAIEGFLRIIPERIAWATKKPNNLKKSERLPKKRRSFLTKWTDTN